MLLLLLTLLFHCGLIRCGEFEKSKFKELLRKEHEHKTRRYDRLIMKDNITDVYLNSTSGAHQTDQLSLQYSSLTTPLGNETYTRDNPRPFLISSPFPNHSSVPTSPEREPTHLENSGMTSPTNFRSDYIHSTISNIKETTYIPSPEGLTPVGTSNSSPNMEKSFTAIHLPGFSLDFVSYPAINFDPSVAENAKKWLQEKASFIAHVPRPLIPKFSSIFEYDYTTQEFPVAIRRNRKIFRSELDIRELKNNAFKHRIQPIEHRIITVPQISKRTNPESEDESFWRDPARRSEEPVLFTTATKQRLKPALLLGKATITDVRITEDVGELEKTTLGNDENIRIMRLHELPARTKMLYSDQTKVQLEVTGNSSPTTGKQFLRHIKTEAPTPHTHIVTASTTQNSFKMAETPQYQEAYMIVFLTELTRLIATKEKKAVRDVVKHTDQIMRGYYKSGQLQRFGQPLMNVTQKLARSLKESEIDVIQKEAANMHHTLTQRRQMLSEDVNTILEYADSLYDDDEKEHLLEVLNEFAAYPNVTLSGYWLCNSLINNFLRPYRRLIDTQQRQQLMDSVNLALRTKFTFSEYNETSELQRSHSETTRTSRIRKRKRHHRSHKRIRRQEKKLYQI